MGSGRLRGEDGVGGEVDPSNVFLAAAEARDQERGGESGDEEMRVPSDRSGRAGGGNQKTGAGVGGKGGTPSVFHSRRDNYLYALPSCAEGTPRVDAAREGVTRILRDVHASDLQGCSAFTAALASDRVLLSASEGFDLPIDNILAALDAFVERLDDLRMESDRGRRAGKHDGAFAARPIRVHLVNRVELEVTPWLSWTDPSMAVRVSATPTGTILSLADETATDANADGVAPWTPQKKAKGLLGGTPEKALTVVGCSAEEVELALVAAALSAGGVRGAIAVNIPPLALGFRDNMVGDCLDIGILPSVQGAEVSVAAAVESSEGLTNALNNNITQRMGWAR